MEDQNLPTDSKEQTAQDNLEFNSRIPLQELQQAIEALKAQLLEKMGQWVKKDDLEGMFSWL